MRYYPLYDGPNTSMTYMTPDYLEWTDNHYESALVSMTIPEAYRAGHGHLFPGPGVFRMLFSDVQKVKVAEFFDQLVDRIEQEKAAVVERDVYNTMIERRKEVVDKQITVLINNKPAAISYQDEDLGAVLCPFCGNPVQTPSRDFDRIREVLEDMDHIKPYTCETLSHCKTCNELYKVEIDINPGG